MQKNTLKEIIQANKKLVATRPPAIVRDSIQPPETDVIKKAVVFSGVGRSGKTFILIDIHQKDKERTLYVDHEDERLKGFAVSDFERLREAFLELSSVLRLPRFFAVSNLHHLFPCEAHTHSVIITIRRAYNGNKRESMLTVPDEKCRQAWR